MRGDHVFGQNDIVFDFDLPTLLTLVNPVEKTKPNTVYAALACLQRFE